MNELQMASGLKSEYFDWIYKLVIAKPYSGGHSYRLLLKYLDSVQFTYSNPMDANREDDGVDLRYRFGYENDVPDSAITAYLDNRPCTVLETMAALCFRCEEHIMSDDSLGDRTSRWFMEMLGSMGISDMYDTRFDAAKVGRTVGVMLDRRYSVNGKGGLFTVKEPRTDMRRAEIWYQMCWYLDELV